MQDTQQTREAIRQAESAIRAVVGKLSATNAVGEADKDDIAQILRILVAEKSALHDPSKASLKTFIERIVENKVRDIIAERRAQCRDSRKEACSLDEKALTPGGDESALGETLDIEDALRRAGLLPWPADISLVLDVRAVLDDLSEADRLICRVLAATRSQREAARDLGIHVETLRERVAKIRARFEARGITGV